MINDEPPPPQRYIYDLLPEEICQAETEVTISCHSEENALNFVGQQLNGEHEYIASSHWPVVLYIRMVISAYYNSFDVKGVISLPYPLSYKLFLELQSSRNTLSEF